VSTSGWDFRNPVRIVGGTGSVAQVGALTRELDGGRCERVVLVSSHGARARGDLDGALAVLPASTAVEHVVVGANPGVDEVDRLLAELGGGAPACVVAIGGGSTMDTAKVLAVGLATPGFSVRAHLEAGGPLPAHRRPLVCVPTTAGTGSEVTPFATVWDGATKCSVSGDTVYPDVAVLDAALTTGLPRDVTISTGLDALTQGLEAMWGRRPTPVTDAIASRAVALALDTLACVVAAPADLTLRAAMLDVSMLAGLAISHTRTALSHSISYPLTGRYGVPHGLACAFSLPDVFRFNCAEHPERFAAVARAVGASDAAGLLARVEDLLTELDVAGLLAPYFAGRDHPRSVAGEMLTPGRADNNLASATPDDVRRIVDAAVDRWELSVTRDGAEIDVAR
jgi:alcohol dehydrogenase